METKRTITLGRRDVIWAAPVFLGIVCLYLSMMVLRHQSLQEALRTAESVEITPKAQGINGGPLVGVSVKYQSNIFAVLKTSSHFHSSPIANGKRDYLFVINRPGKLIEEEAPSYWYDTNTGELGRDKEWCFVPIKFKHWMQGVRAKAPKVTPPHVEIIHGITIISPQPPPVPQSR